MIPDDQLPVPEGCEHNPGIACYDCYWKRKDAEKDLRSKPLAVQQATHAERQAAIEAWQAAARAAASALSREGDGGFTVDDVWDRLDQQQIRTVKASLMGPLITRLVRQGHIYDTGQTRRSTRRPGAQVSIYRRKRP